MKYVLAAESGLGFAQSNVAHLCEVNDVVFVDLTISTKKLSFF